MAKRTGRKNGEGKGKVGESGMISLAVTMVGASGVLADTKRMMDSRPEPYTTDVPCRCDLGASGLELADCSCDTQEVAVVQIRCC